MKHLKCLILIIIFACLISCSKDSPLDSQQNEKTKEFLYFKEIKVYDNAKENNVTLLISSYSFDSLNAYLESVDFSLVFDVDKIYSNNLMKFNEGEEINENINLEPSVEIELNACNISTEYKNFFIGISNRNLKSDPFWNVPIAAPKTSSDFLGVINIGSVDLGARFNIKEYWFSSYEDIGPSNIVVLNPGEKFYCYSMGSYRLRVSIYARRSLSGVFENPEYFVAYNQSIYDQL
jgi:hypothetical protein